MPLAPMVAHQARDGHTRARAPTTELRQIYTTEPWPGSSLWRREFNTMLEVCNSSYSNAMLHCQAEQLELLRHGREFPLRTARSCTVLGRTWVAAREARNRKSMSDRTVITIARPSSSRIRPFSPRPPTSCLHKPLLSSPPQSPDSPLPPLPQAQSDSIAVIFSIAATRTQMDGAVGAPLAAQP